MAYEYDRYEREDGGGSFLMGLLAGTVLGAGLGMLFAPRPGSELRNQLTEQAGRLKSTAGGAYSQATDKVGKIVDRGREAYDRARSSSGSLNDMTESATGAGSMAGSYQSTTDRT
jgi:gas vesicle protein